MRNRAIWAGILGAFLLYCPQAGAQNPPAAGQVRLHRAIGDPRAFDFPLMNMVVPPDRKELAASGLIIANDLGMAPKLMLVDVVSGQAVHVLQGHEHSVNQLRFSPDSKTLYSGGNPHYGGFQNT